MLPQLVTAIGNWRKTQSPEGKKIFCQRYIDANLVLFLDTLFMVMGAAPDGSSMLVLGGIHIGDEASGQAAFQSFAELGKVIMFIDNLNNPLNPFQPPRSRHDYPKNDSIHRMNALQVRGSATLS